MRGVYHLFSLESALSEQIAQRGRRPHHGAHRLHVIAHLIGISPLAWISLTRPTEDDLLGKPQPVIRLLLTLVRREHRARGVALFVLPLIASQDGMRIADRGAANGIPPRSAFPGSPLR